MPAGQARRTISHANHVFSQNFFGCADSGSAPLSTTAKWPSGITPSPCLTGAPQFAQYFGPDSDLLARFSGAGVFRVPVPHTGYYNPFPSIVADISPADRFLRCTESLLCAFRSSPRQQHEQHHAHRIRGRPLPFQPGLGPVLLFLVCAKGLLCSLQLFFALQVLRPQVRRDLP